MTGCDIKSRETAPEVVAWAENASLYEINIRQYTPEGTFEAFGRHLPRLKELGVDVLWFMPITPISEKNRKGTLGSYYAVKDYRGINSEYGTLEDFKAVVKEAHKLGFKVIVDWVANHTGWDNWLIEAHPDWYTQRDGHIVSPVEDWSDVADLNYDNREMRRYMIESMIYWVKEADIDGFRCDMAGMVPTDFWEEAREALDSVKPVFMLAEAWEPELTRKAFDACYGWDLHHLMNDLAQRKKDGTELPGYFAKVDSQYTARTIVLNFIDNHDENSWSGSVPERMGEAAPVYAVMAYTVPGMPLLYSGQEAGLNKRLPFFEKDSIDWNVRPELAGFYRQLNDLKRSCPALKAGEHGGAFRILNHDNERSVFVYERKLGDVQVIVMLNLTGEEQRSVLAEEITGSFTEYFSGATAEGLKEITLPAHGYRVWMK
ncbi:MAG: alpha-amylase family glycosyl hydrolase [Oscillibacter sp.]|nr:alpha-amylase family glycosyl hydrolase [Oscillibacter sp.]